MCRNGIACWLAVLTVVAGAGASGKTPAARVLEVKGHATIVELDRRDRPAAVFGTIYVDEQLIVADNSQVTLSCRGNGNVVRITAPGTFTLTRHGCEPKTGVEQLPMSKQKRSIIGKISQDVGRDFGNIVQGGVVIVRANPPAGGAHQPALGSERRAQASLGGICPFAGSTLLEAQPKFSWPAIPQAKWYSLQLSEVGQQIWSAKTAKTELEYAGQVPLTRDATYTWEVTASVGGELTTVYRGVFRTASQEECADAKALATLLAHREPACMVLAAMWYRAHGMLREAIAVNEQLAELTANPAVYRELKELGFQAHDENRARAAEEKLLELEPQGSDGAGDRLRN